MAYNGSQRGSMDNLDEQGYPERSAYTRQYARNPGQGLGAPPVYSQYDQHRQPQAVPPSRYGERPEPRSHSPQRYPEERPQDQYFPSRSHSPSSYTGRDQSRERYGERSYSPARSLTPSQSGNYPGYSPQSGYNSQSAYPPQPAARRGPENAGVQPHNYAYSQSGYAPSQSSYGGYSRPGPSRPGPSHGPPVQTGYPGAPKVSYQPRTHNGYQPLNAPSLYATKHPKPKHTTATKDGGYYNVYTDSVVKTKKLRTRAGMTNFLSVTRPWSKNHSNQPRDFMPLVIAAIFFNPVIGICALVLSCLTKKAVTHEDWSKAGLYGRITFWLSITAILLGIIFFMILLAVLHNNGFAPRIH